MVTAGGIPMRIPIRQAFLILILSGTIAHAAEEQSFDDPMFQRCVKWMLDGQRGAMIDNICLDQYEIPPPSLFLCARKVQSGFVSPTDREVCAIVFEEEVRKVRAGFVK